MSTTAPIPKHVAESPDGSTCKCKHCGERIHWVECQTCGGEGGFDGYEQDPNWYHPGEMAPCPNCSYDGGWWEHGTSEDFDE